MKINNTMVLFFTLVSFLCPNLIFAADSSTHQTKPPLQKQGLISKPKVNVKRECGIDANVEKNLMTRKWAISSPVAIRKAEIPASSDNVKQVQQLFIGKEKLFDSFTSLHRYMLHNNKTRLNARLYCFDFKSSQHAKKWFNVIDKTKVKGKRQAIFSKPKKLLAIAGNRVFLLEGYHIRNFDSLKEIVKNLPGVQFVLDPDKKVTNKNL